MPHTIRNFRVNRRVKSIRVTENFHWSILFARFSSFQSILDILDSSIRFYIHSPWILANHVVYNTESRFHPWSLKYRQNGTNYPNHKRSDILPHRSRQSTSLSSSLRVLGRFPFTHRACTSFWNVFSSSSSKTVGTSGERERDRERADVSTQACWESKQVEGQ